MDPTDGPLEMRTTHECEDPTLRWYMERLKILNDVHAALGASINLEESLSLILDRVFDHLGPVCGAILLKDAEGDFRAVARRGTEDTDLLCPPLLLRTVAERGTAALVLDARSEECLAATAGRPGEGVRSLVAAPLHDPSDPIGMILLTSHLGADQLSEMDKQLLVSLASVAAMRVRTNTLAEEAAERNRLEEEVNLARRIQLALLPEKLPHVPGYELLGVNLPSRGVSGDYYKAEMLRGGWEVVLWVADVCGKGVAASLLMASLEALSAAPIKEGLDPDEVFGRVSPLLYDRTPPERFATAFLAALEPVTGRVRYANAGHNPALVVRTSGQKEWLHSTGIPLGLLRGYGYGMRRLELEPGDALFLYTDGITETTNPEGEEFGDERFAEVCAAHRDEGLEALAKALESELDEFARGVPFGDDRTLLAVHRLKP